MATVKVTDGEIFYETQGKGVPLLLVSGLGGTSTYWRGIAGRFAEHFQVILHDQRGTGRSSRSHMKYSVEQMAEDLLAVMDDAGVERCYLLGHSTGGAIGQVMAVEEPDRLAGLVLYSSWTRSDAFFRRVMNARKALLSASDGGRAYVSARAFFVYPDWWINANEEKLAEDDERNLQKFPGADIVSSRIDAILAFDRVADLGRIRIPTLVVCAKDDFLTPVYFSTELADRIPNAVLQILERGGHGAAHTVPDEFIQSILPFLLRLQAGKDSSREVCP